MSTSQPEADKKIAESVEAICYFYQRLRRSLPLARRASDGQPASQPVVHEVPGAPLSIEFPGLDIKDHLDFVSGVLERAELPDETSEGIRAQLKKIRMRSTDYRYYVAVVGEFGSGKSTFINAMLRDSLLESCPLATTAIETRIYHHPKLDVEVEFQDGASTTYRSQDYTTAELLVRFFSQNGDRLEKNRVREFLRPYTTVGEESENVARVKLCHNAKVLSDGLVIIDTPGINTKHARHAEITYSVIRDVADIAIVIIPAIEPVSQTLLQFLKGPIKSYIHRCIFVATHMEKIDSSEHDAVIQTISGRLCQYLEVDPPEVYPCAPQLVLDELNGRNSSSNNAVWKDRFSELESTVLKKMQGEKILSISETLARLTDRMLETLDEGLLNKKAICHKQYEVIDQQTIRGLLTFIEEERGACERVIKAAMSKMWDSVRSAADDHAKRLKNRIRGAIFASDSWKKLEAAINISIDEYIHQERENLEVDVNPKMKAFRKAERQAASLFEKRFLEEYHQIKQALRSSPPAFAPANPEGIRIDVGKPPTWVKSVVKNWKSRNLVRKLISGTSPDDLKKEAWQKAQNDIDVYFRRIHEALKNQVSRQERDAVKVLRKHMDAYGEKFDGVITSIQKKRTQEQEELKHLVKTIDKDRQNVCKKRKALKDFQELCSDSKGLDHNKY